MESLERSEQSAIGRGINVAQEVVFILVDVQPEGEQDIESKEDQER